MLLMVITLLLCSFSITMRIVQVNCSGLSKFTKSRLYTYVDEQRIDVLCLQETWLKDSKLNFKKWVPNIRNAQDGYGGVAILTHPAIKAVRMDNLLHRDLEAVWSKIQIGKQIVIIGSVYIRPGDIAKIQILQNTLKKIDRNTPVILTGDFNGKSRIWQTNYQPPRDKNDKPYQMGLQLEQMILELSLEIQNSGTHTHISRRDGSTSALDLFLSREITYQKRWFVDQTVVLKSDHMPTVLDVVTEVDNQTKKKWNLKDVSWDLFGYTLNQDLEKLADSEDYRLADTARKCELMQEAIIKSAEETIPKKEISRHSKAFITDRLKSLQKEFLEAKKNFKKRNAPHNLRTLDTAREKYCVAYLEERDKFWQNVCRNTEQKDLWTTVNKITNNCKSKCVQPLYNQDGTHEFDDNKIADRLKKTHITKTNMDTSDFDDDWFTSVNSAVPDIVAAEKGTLLGQQHELYNTDLKMSEVSAAIGHLKPDGSPGPDGVLPIMLKRAEEAVEPQLHRIFQLCWESGLVPPCWKKDNKIFIPKEGYEHNTEKALRPLSLNAVIGKTYEYIVAMRYIWWLETQFKIDWEQFAYRRARGVVQALLTMVTAIHQGFEKGEPTIATLIDLEGAFDTLWREGVIYSMHEIGVRGRLLCYASSFLEDRKSRLLVNTHTGDWFTTSIGVPQGAVISPILFIVYISRLTTTVASNIKFADDISCWITHVDIRQACSDMENELDQINSWCCKWRLKISTRKTEVMCFNRGPHTPIDVKLGGQILTQVRSKRCLGVTVDEQLTFSEHIENVRCKAIKALTAASSLLDDIHGLRTGLGVQLYRGLILPYITFALPVWCTIGPKEISKLEEVQRVSLQKILGCHSNTALNAMEVLAGCPPIRLLITEQSALEYVRILRKEDGDALKAAITNEVHKQSTYLSPAKYMQRATKSLQKDLNLDKLDPEPKYHPNRMGWITVNCDTLEGQDNFGSSKNRTVQQAQAARISMQNHIQELTPDIIPVFTDGSALSNPGPCGAAAVIYPRGLTHDPVILEKEVSIKSTSFHGELCGIQLALSYTNTMLTENSPKPSCVLIHTDCKAALDTIVQGCERQYSKIVGNCASLITDITNMGVDIRLMWIPGHAGIRSNDLADKAAKEAATRASHLSKIQDQSDISLNACSQHLKQITVKQWQSKWDSHDTGRHTHSLVPQVPKCPTSDTLGKSITRSGEVRLNRLRSGTHLLRAHPYRQSLDRRAGEEVTSTCECTHAVQDIKHVLLECPLSQMERNQMMSAIEESFLNNHGCPSSLKVDTNILLGYNKDLPGSVSKQITHAVCAFLAS